MKLNYATRIFQLASLLLLLMFTSGSAMALCSSMRGKLSINEYNFIDNWIELKVLDPSIISGGVNPFDKVKVSVWKSNGSKMSLSKEESVGSIYQNKTNTCNGTTDTYIKIPFSASDLGNDVIVVLWKTDEGTKGSVIDLFRLGQSSLAAYPTSINDKYVNYDFCGVIENALPSSKYDAPLLGSSNNKDIARLPDGTGPWFISNGNGNNSQNSLCTSNNTLFHISKLASSDIIGIGSGNPFTWTFNAKNGGDTGNLTNVTMTDTLPANMYLSACPAGASCAGTAGAYTSITYNFGTLSPLTSASIVATAYVTAAGSYENMVTGTADEYKPAYTTSYKTVQTLTVGSFNAFETGTAAGATTGVIKTKIAGSAFALDVVAISSGVQSTSFTNDVKVELLANTDLPGTNYGSDNCPKNNSVLQTISSTKITGGRSAVNFSAVADAYKDVRVKVSYPTTSPTVISCSTDSFAIRPNVLSLAITDQDWITAGNTNTLNNVSASGGSTHKAGRPISVSGAAYNAAAVPVTTANYAGTPATILSACSGTACATNLGAFSLGSSFVSGVLSSTTATYSEVGSFNLQLRDTAYAAIDSADTAADCSATGYYVCSAATAVGRFVPDHFDTTLVLASGVPMSCATGLTCPAIYNGMVYSGQEFTLYVTARNFTNNTTSNYSSATGLAKDITLAAWDALGSTATKNPGPGTLANNVVLNSAFVGGVGSTSLLTYNFSSLPATPTAPTAIYVRANDTDSVSSLRSVTTDSVEGGVEVVSGRIKLNNVYGSEFLPLTVTASAQYFSINGWVSNANDGNSTLTGIPASYTVGGGTSTVTLSPASGTLSAGTLAITLGKPGRPGVVTIAPSHPYLSVINGTATFGVYSTNNRLIYQREMY